MLAALVGLMVVWAAASLAGVGPLGALSSIGHAPMVMEGVPGMDGMTYTVLAVVSRAVGTNDPSVGWSYHLINTALLGAAFGLLLGNRVTRLGSAIGFGLGFIVQAVAASPARHTAVSIAFLPR